LVSDKIFDAEVGIGHLNYCRPQWLPTESSGSFAGAGDGGKASAALAI